MKFLLASVSILIFTMISGTQQLIVMTGGSALPNYNITEELGADMEIRRLETTRYVSLNTNDEEAQKLTNLDWGIRHWRLVTYLTGYNSDEKYIPMGGMTTLAFVNLDANGSISFEQVEPSSRVLTVTKIYIGKENWQNLPRPTESSVQVVEEPPVIVAAVRFGGYATIQDYFKYRDILVEQLGTRSSDFDLYAILTASYDPLWKFWSRRNEVWILKKGWKETIVLQN